MNIRIWFVSKIFRSSTAKSLLWACISSFNVAEDRRWCWLMIAEIDCFESKIIAFIRFAFKFIAELFRFFIRCVYSRIVVFKSYLSRHRDVLAHVISNWYFSRSEIIASNSKWNVASEKKERLSIFFKFRIIEENDHDYWNDEIFTCVALFFSDHRSRSFNASTTRILLLEDSLRARVLWTYFSRSIQNQFFHVVISSMLETLCK
jgi:hypothetical protein